MVKSNPEDRSSRLFRKIMSIVSRITESHVTDDHPGSNPEKWGFLDLIANSVIGFCTAFILVGLLFVFIGAIFSIEPEPDHSAHIAVVMAILFQVMTIRFLKRIRRPLINTEEER